MSKAAAAVLFWVAVALLQKFNWDLGVWKALVLAALLAAVPLAIAQAQRSANAATGAPAPRLLKAVVLMLLLAHTGYAVAKLRHPSLIDAALITIAEGQGVRAGGNPYASQRDAEAAAGTHDARFAGYKYLPVTLAAYLPLGGALGPRGIVLTNLLLQFVVVALIFRLGAALASAGAGWLAMLLYLSLPMVPFQLFAKGVLDLVAVVPLLGALLLVERKPALGGLCLGLSLAAKLLPGGLLLPCALPARPRDRLLYAAGIAVGLLPIVPFVLWAPTAFLDNIMLFNFVRPTDSTSWLFTVPSARPVAAAAMATLYLAALAAAWLRPPATLAQRCGMAMALILASLIAAPAVHHNYHLWWLPLTCALLGAALAPRRLPSGAPAATKASPGSI